MSDEIRRENFADEASYLQFQRNMLEMERLQQERDRMYGHATRGRDYDIVKKMRRKEKKRLYHREHREQEREYNCKWRTEHPDQHRKHVRMTRLRHLEEYRERDRWYNLRHRKEKNAYMFARWRKNHPEACTPDEISAKARTFWTQVNDLRSAGLSWIEVAKTLNRSEQSCKMAMYRFKQSHDIPNYHLARRFEEQVAEARDLGFSWPQIARLLDRSTSGCYEAYKRYCKLHKGKAS